MQHSFNNKYILTTFNTFLKFYENKVRLNNKTSTQCKKILKLTRVRNKKNIKVLFI